MEPLSAGTYPAAIVQPETIATMAEKSVSLEGQTPKTIRSIDEQQVDLLVNMSGSPLPALLPDFPGGNLVWEVIDPIGRSMQVYAEVRDRIESLVAQLAETLRKHNDAKEE
jgi:protein-tyrosine-phosphatase